jgi:hypothetical protein
MDDDSHNQDRQAQDDQRQAEPGSPWVQHYGAKHRWQRLTGFPAGLQPPVKVRIYHRTNHFILQWWDPSAKRNLADRLNGDLLAALIAARKIDERLTSQHTAGAGRRRLGPPASQFTVSGNWEHPGNRERRASERKASSDEAYDVAFSDKSFVGPMCNGDLLRAIGRKVTRPEHKPEAKPIPAIPVGNSVAK